MASFTGSSIFDILTNQRVPATGASPLDTTHTFTVNSVNIGQVEVLHFYGDQTVTSGTVNDYFSDVTTNQDEIMCIRVFHGNLTIESGAVFRPPFRTKGMFVYVKGSLSLGDNARISMTGRGSSAAGQNVAIWSGATIPATGGAGASSVSVTLSTSGIQPVNGNSASAATNRATGGGGGGAIHAFVSNGSSILFTGGAGSAGTSYAGGSGGGALASGSNSSRTAGSATGTTGGAGVSTRNSSGATPRRAGGGAGVIAGAGTFTSGAQTVGSSAETSANNAGAGGLLMIACLNEISFGSGARFESNGSGDGGLSFLNNQNQFIAPGGSSGGGSVNVLSRSSVSSTNMQAAGGAGTTASGSASDGGTPYTVTSGAGGNGATTSDTLSVGIRRHLFIRDGQLRYFNFNTNTWTPVTGSAPEVYQSYGMLDAEVTSLTKGNVTSLYGSSNLSNVTLRTFVPN